MATQTDLRIPSSKPDHSLALTVYLPPPTTVPPPVIIMAHGIGAIRKAGLAPFATTFNEQGYAAVTFDYLHFGDSDGEPRQLLSVSRELQDFRDVVAWARDPRRIDGPRFDPAKIVAWGSSFGGMHVVALLAEDHSLAAGIAQCPCVDGLAASLKPPIATQAKLTALATRDIAGSLLGRPPVLVSLSGDGKPASPVALMSGAEAVEGWARITPPEIRDSFRNEIAARSLLSVSTSRPVSSVHKSVAPLLVVVSEYDNEAPLEKAKLAAQRAPKGELVQVSGGHFDVYEGGKGYEKNVEAQREFLARVLG